VIDLQSTRIPFRRDVSAKETSIPDTRTSSNKWYNYYFAYMASRVQARASIDCKSLIFKQVHKSYIDSDA